MGCVLLECVQGVGEDVRSGACACACVRANVLEAGECSALRGCGEAVDELCEERKTLVAGAGDVPGVMSLVF